MKLLINELNEIKWRLTSEKLSLYPLVLRFTLATSRILNVFMSTIRVEEIRSWFTVPRSTPD